MAMEIYSPQECRFGFQAESTFGTAIADNAAIDEFYPLEPPTVNDNYEAELFRRSWGKPTDDKRDWVVNTNHAPTMQLKLPLSKSIIEEMLQGILQSTSTGSGDETITFFTAAPDFSINAGTFFTLGIRKPVASQHVKFTSAIISELTFSCYKDQDFDRLIITPTFIAAAPISRVANFSGTWTAITESFYNFSDITAVNIAGDDGLAAGFMGFELTLRNGAMPTGYSGTRYQNFSLGNVEVEGKILVNADDTGYWGNLSNYAAGSSIALDITFGTAGQSKYLKFDTNAVITAYPEEGTDEVLTGDIPFRCVDSAADNDLLSIIYNVT